MELEKDLGKKGVKHKEQPKKDVTPSKPKITLEEELNIPVQDIWSIYDLNYFTYGESDLLIQRSIHKRIGQVEDRIHRIFLEQLKLFLEGDFARQGSVGEKSVYFDSLNLTKDLYATSRSPIEALKNLLREYSSSPVALLSVAEVLLFAGKFRDAAKLFRSAFSILKDPYIGLLLEAYDTGQINAALFANCISQGGYKLLVLLISALTEDEERAIKIADVLDKKSYACAKYAACRAKMSKNDEYTFCPRIVILNQAIDYANKGSFDKNLVEALSNFDPQALVLLLSEAAAKKDYEGIKEYLSKLINSSESVTFATANKTNLPICTRGIFGRYAPSKNFISINDPEEGAKKLIELIVQFGDVQIVFKDMEFLRLYYGERHCRNLYRRA